MVRFILDIDWMTTIEFCETYKIPHPYFIGDIKTSADLFLQVDAIKQKMFVEYAKLLNKDITAELLKKLGFECLDTRGGFQIYKNGKYQIIDDQYGFWLDPYDSADGRRVHKINDLIDLSLTYKSNL